MAATQALTAWARASPNAQPGSESGAELRCGLVGSLWLAGLACRRAPFQGGEPTGAGPCQGKGPCMNEYSFLDFHTESERRLRRCSSYASCRTVSKNNKLLFLVALPIVLPMDCNIQHNTTPYVL